MSSFYETESCRDQTLCSICRQCREFRIVIKKRYDEVKEVDFICPKGKPIVYANFPTSSQKIRNVLNATAKIIRHTIEKRELPIVTKEVKDQRLQICFKCNHYKPTALGPRCTSCSCFIGLKDILKTEKCPKGKW